MADDTTASILVVDDNPATRYSTGRVLRAAGFRVCEAATGQQALDMADDAPDAVILDVNLPDIDGFEVCRVLRAREKTRRTPIIHLSATFVGSGHKVQGLEAGADGYLTQPVEPPVLVATVNAFLRARAAEEQLSRSEAKFRAIFDQAVNGIILMSSELIYLEVNAAMCGILGRERADIVGKHVSAFVASGHESVAEDITRALRRADTWSGTFPLLRSGGAEVDLEWNISIHSVPDVLLAVVADVTQRRAAEAERERLLASERMARTDAERANRLKDEFLATVSHELRSPLNAVLGWSQLLKLRESSNIDDYRAGIDAIDRNARVQAQLISDLIDVSSIASGKLHLDLQQVDLADVIRHSLDDVAHAASAKSIAIAQDIRDGEAIISGDARRLQQVMFNLLTNAIKFTAPDGHVAVRLERQASHAKITVRDNGQGISSEFLPYIFEPFRQQDATTTRFHQGLGLGLAIVRNLVEMHGGSVLAQSPGQQQGSVFIVRLPLGAATGKEPVRAAQPRVLQTPADTDILRGLRVLVVDDDADARLIVRRHLSDYAAVVTEAQTAPEAMSALVDAKPQILISDVGMPKDDGYHLVSQVRAAGYSAQELPAIALTAYARPVDQGRMLSGGFQAHLAKPIDLGMLITTVADLVRASKQKP